MFGFGHATILGFLGVRAPIRQIVIRFDNASVVAIAETDHNQRFFVAFLPLVRAGDHASLSHFDNERTFRAVAHVDSVQSRFSCAAAHWSTRVQGRLGERPRPE